MMSNRLRGPLVSLLVVLLAACGGGSSGPPAPSGLSYSTPPAYTINVAITALTPTVTGTVTGYTVSPSLPAGLNLNTTTGVISGTPTAITPSATYTVMASNTSGDAAAKLTIVVNDLVPTVAYGSPSYTFTNGVPGRIAAPKAGGGTIVSWQVSPALPAGLELSTTDGSISGTPTAGVAAANYVVTAANSGGPATASFSIAVSSSPLVDLGHAATVQQIRFGVADVLTQDADAHWVLWNYSAGTMLASGNNMGVTNNDLDSPVYAPLPVDLEGTTAVIQTGTSFQLATGLQAATGLEVVGSSNGQVLAQIATAVNWWKLASDGSYICGGNSSGLTVWSPSGAVRFSEPGAYASAEVFAAPNQILLANGPNPNAIETINLTAGTSALSPAYQGTFSSWFTDGSSFLTVAGDAVWVYSDTGVQEDARVLSGVSNLGGAGSDSTGLGGTGGWFWTFTSAGTLNVYAVGSSAQPAATYSPGFGQFDVSGSKLAYLQYGAGSLIYIDLSGVALSGTTYSTPVAYLSAFGAGSGSSWLVGNEHGVLVDGATLSSSQPRFLDYGQALSVAGSTSNIVVATASGRMLYFNASTLALEGTINFTSSDVALSSDGTVLAAAANALDAQYETDRTINIYSLPSMAVVNSFPNTFDANNLAGSPYAITLSGSGTVLGEMLTPDSACDSQAVTIASGGVLLCDNSGIIGTLLLSPDGTLVAESPSSYPADESGLPITYIYKNGTLSSSIPAVALGWLDNTRLLASDFSAPTEDGQCYCYTQASIYSVTGQLMNSVALPSLISMQVATSTTVYSPSLQSIYSLTDGSKTWMSGSQFLGVLAPIIGAVGGSYVVFPANNFVLAEPY